MKYILAILLVLPLAACGTTPTERTLSGGAIGAGTGAVIGGIIGGSSGARLGAAIGAGAGALGGAVTNEEDIDLTPRSLPR